MSDEIRMTEYERESLRTAESRDKEERALKRERMKHRVVSFAIFIAVLGINGIALIIWQGNKGPSAEQQVEERLRSQCTEEHGTWIKVEDGSTKGQGTCIWNGKDSE